MRTLKFLLLSLLIPLGFAQSSVIPLPPCTLNFTLSNTTLTSGTFPNNAPSCDKWTVTAYVVGTGSFTLTLQAAPPATTSTPGSWATYPGTVATGSNPLTATGIATFTNGTTATQFLRLLLNVTSGTATVYGVLQGSQTVVSKGGGGGGGGGGPTIAGTANEIAAIGAGCTNPSTATCTISIVNNAALPGAPTTTTPAPGDSSSKIATTAFISALLAGCTFTSGNFACPGTISSGVGSGATGALDLVGKTSAATSTVTVDDANTATVVKLPNDATGGLYFATSPTATPAAGCAQYNGTGTEAVSTATPCGSSSATGGATNGYSAPAVTLPAAGTTFIPPVGGALPSSTEANVQWVAPVTAPISNMGVLLSAAIGTGNTISFTFSDNTTPQTVTCTASGTGAGGTACSDLTHSFNVTAGDKLTIKITTTGIVAIAPTITIGFEYGGGGSGGGGSFVLVEEHTASSSAELDFTTCISSTYDDYELRFVAVTPASNNVTLEMQMSTDGGVSYDAGTNYDFSFGFAFSGGPGGGGSASQTFIQIAANIGTASAYGLSGSWAFPNPGSSSQFKNLSGTHSYFNAGASVFLVEFAGGVYKVTTAVNAFRFLMSSGNIASGTVRCYGLTH